MSAFKRGMISMLDALGIAEAATRVRRHDVVLCYHSVERMPSGYPHSVSLESFRAHVDYLAARYDVVALGALFEPPGSRSRAAITFDDGFAELHEVVFPIAAERGLPFTVFVPTHFPTERSRLLAEYGLGSAKDHITWDQMRAMRATGLVAFESHGHAHVDAVRQIAQFEHDLLQSIAIIERELGYRARYFAYPFGNCNSRTHAVAFQCGFERLFTIESRLARGRPVEGRIEIGRANERLEHFKLAVAGINTFALRKRLGRMPPARGIVRQHSHSG